MKNSWKKFNAKILDVMDTKSWLHNVEMILIIMKQLKIKCFMKRIPEKEWERLQLTSMGKVESKIKGFRRDSDYGI